MKGTLFSADFVWDGNDPKLLEINTDTAFIDESIDLINFSDFIEVLQTNSISELHVIYKTDLHLNFVKKLKEVVSQSATFITDFVEYGETIDTIYPTSVVDSSEKFILRLAYDASAIFDDTYARTDFNLYKLFNDNNDTGSIVELYHSSSIGYLNTIENSLNLESKPDFVLKPTSPYRKSLQFVKLQGTGSVDEKVNELLLDESMVSNFVVSKYYPSSGNYGTSTRTFQIIYGNSLDLCYLCDYEINALLDYPETIVTGSDKTVHVIDGKHYYEFATNDASEEKGVLPDTMILKDSDVGEEIQNLVVGDVVDSFLINGYSSDETITETWFQSGSVLPTGSYNTSSIVYDNTDVSANTSVLHEFIIESSSAFYSSGGTLLLSYKNSDDKIRFRNCVHLEVGDLCYDRNGNPKSISEHNVLFLDLTSSLHLNFLDVEETDNYVISGSNIVVHNAPCFVEGTRIKTSETTHLPIELIEEGYEVLTYNFSTKQNEKRNVLEVTNRIVDSIVEYELENGTKLRATLDHPLYEVNKGWSSYDNDLSNTLYTLEQKVQKLEVGDVLKLSNDISKILNMNLIYGEVKVYNLSHVENNNNFFAEDVLVHNRVFGIFTCFSGDSKVEMWDGSLKNIEDVVVGDEVKSFKNGEFVKGTVTDFCTHEIGDTIKVTKYKGMTADREHPYFNGSEWRVISELEDATLTEEYIDTFYNLEIDGSIETSDKNYIIEGIIVSGLGNSGNRI